MEYVDYEIDVDENFQALTEAYEEGYIASELVENIDKFVSLEGQPGIDLLVQYALQNQVFDIIDVLNELGIDIVEAILDVSQIIMHLSNFI